MQNYFGVKSSRIFKILAILFCVGFVVFQPKPVSAIGWLSGWGFRKDITISNTNVDADLSNFPVLIKIEETGGGSTNIGYNVSDTTNGYDIRFTDADGTTLIPYERESFSVSSSNLTANLWVKVPTISSSGVTHIYIYYNNSGQSITDWTVATSSITNCTTITNAQCVWKEGVSQNFAGVYHLGETGNGSVGNYKDSTSNANNSTNTTGQPTATAIAVGNGQSFDGTQEIDLTSSIAFTGQFDISFWGKETAADLKGMVMSNNPSGGAGPFIWFWNGSSFNTRNTVDAEFAFTDLTNFTTLAHYELTRDGSNLLTLYKNGAYVNSKTATGTYSFQYLGAGFSSSFWLAGLLDEVRFSSITKPAEWVKFEYHNQTDSGNNLTFAAQEAEVVLSSDATIVAGTLASQAIAGTFTGGANIGASSALTVTIPDASKTNAALLLTKGNANSTINYIKSSQGSQPENDAAYTGTYSAGSTTVTVANNDIIWLLVTAEDTTTKLYYKITVTVSPPPSNDANLSNITLSSGTLSPSFASSTTSYTASVANGITSITVTPTVNQANATVTVNGTTVTSGSPSGSITLSDSAPTTITIVVTAQDGVTQKSYGIAVSVAAAIFEVSYVSTDANGVKSYSVTSSYNGSSATTLRVLEPNNPTPGRRHNFIYALPVEAGLLNGFGDGLTTLRLLDYQNTYNVTIIAPSFEIEPWYKDTATPADRPESFITEQLQPWVQANLSTTGSEQHWLLGFSKSGFGSMYLTLKYPTLFNLGAAWDFVTLDMNSAFLDTYKTPFLINNRLWISGYNFFQQTVIDFDNLLTSKGIVHTSALDVQTTHQWDNAWVTPAVAQLYADSIVLNDATLSNIAISSGTLSPSFASSTTSYTASVANGIASIAVTPTVNQANATVMVNGTAVASGVASDSISLSVGSNTITVLVTALDGLTQNTYTITVTVTVTNTIAGGSGGLVKTSSTILQIARDRQIQQVKDTIAKLIIQLNILLGKPSTTPVINQQIPDICKSIFTRTLAFRMIGQDVKCLQIILNQDPDTQVALSGIGSPGKENIRFGPATWSAVIKFQEKYASEILLPKFTHGTGIVGQSTIKKLNALIGK